MPKVVVLLERGAVKVLASDPGIAVLVVDRSTEGADACITVEAHKADAEAVAAGIPLVAPQRVDAIFAEAGPQLEALSHSDTLGARERTQLSNLAKGWFCLDDAEPAG